MFGIAIWDAKRRRLVLGRDRLGKKPLFYAEIGGRFLFASEIKALLAAAPEAAELDGDAIVPYFRFGFIPEPRTMYRRIRKLPAAHWLVYENGQITIGAYWQLRFHTDDRPRDWVQELDQTLAESVRLRLMSEVPLGVFLSGGLDSSAVAAYAQRVSNQQVKTFTIGFDVPAWDESSDAALVARHCGTDHRVLTLSQSDLTRDLPGTLVQLVRHVDEPFGDSSALPTFMVSKLAREHVTVVLGGDGGDELFAGYSIYRGLRFRETYSMLPKWLGGQALPALAAFGASHVHSHRRYALLRAAKVLADSALPLEEAYASKQALCTNSLLQRLLTPAFASGLSCPQASSLPRDVHAVMASDLPLVSKISYADIRFGLLEDMLVKVDRMTMAHSLELRAPFLDHRLVELAAAMPPSLKLRGQESKAILREVLRRYLPPETLRKRKQGFGVPLGDWIREGLGEMVSDYLEADNGRALQGFVEPAAVRQVLTDHRAGRADYRSQIWLLLNLAVWRDLYLSPSKPASPPPPPAPVPQAVTPALSVR
jgi:asparagine synthase (glutamine-hydrolysing)